MANDEAWVVSCTSRPLALAHFLMQRLDVDFGDFMDITLDLLLYAHDKLMKTHVICAVDLEGHSAVYYSPAFQSLMDVDKLTYFSNLDEVNRSDWSIGHKKTFGTMDVAEDIADVLNELSGNFELSDRNELFLEALSFIDWTYQKTQEGRILLSCDEEGGNSHLLPLPWLKGPFRPGDAPPLSLAPFPTLQ